MSSDGTLGAGARWIEALLAGPFASSLAIVAVAYFGFSMLTGHLSLRRGGALVLGCFILFGASSIASGLIDISRSSSGQAIPSAPLATSTGPPSVSSLPAYDPYAGAAVRTTE